MVYTEADVDRLGSKLDAMHLDDGEAAALRALITFAAQYPADAAGLNSATPASVQLALHRVLLEPALT